MANDMQYHHVFPKAWLMRGGTSFEDANVLANIVMLTAISNQAVADQPPSAYLKDEIAYCGEREMLERLDTSLISGQAYNTAMHSEYQRSVAARAERLLAWAQDLTSGETRITEQADTDDPEIVMRAMTVEVMDTDTDD